MNYRFRNAARSNYEGSPSPNVTECIKSPKRNKTDSYKQTAAAAANLTWGIERKKKTGGSRAPKISAAAHGHHPDAAARSKRQLLRRQTGHGRKREGVKNRQLGFVPRSMLEANAWRAVKHAGHHEAGGRLPPTYSCYCVRYCIIQDLLLMLYGAKKGNERREKHGPFCSHLSSVTAAAVFLDWRPEGEIGDGKERDGEK